MPQAQINKVDTIAQTRMTRTEAVLRAVSPSSAAVYDIGKELSKGKSLSEGYKTANKNFKVVQTKVTNRVKSAAEKTEKEMSERTVFERYFTSAINGYVGTFIKNLFE